MTPDRIGAAKAIARSLGQHRVFRSQLALLKPDAWAVNAVLFGMPCALDVTPGTLVSLLDATVGALEAALDRLAGQHFDHEANRALGFVDFEEP